VANPNTIDEYLSGVSEPQREALQKLRGKIRAIAPDAEECISYRIPTFKQDGMLVSFAAWSDHCSLYPLSGELLDAFKDEIRGFATGKGTLQFQPDHLPPDALIRAIVERRLAQNAKRKAAKAASRKAAAAAR